MTTIPEITLTLHSVRGLNMVITACCIYLTYIMLVTGKAMITVLIWKQVAVAYYNLLYINSLIYRKVLLFFLWSYVVIFIYFSTGSSPSDNIYQSPAVMYRYPGEKAVIICSHSIQNYDQILWYKQLQNAQLQLLGYIYGGSKFPEPRVEEKMDGKAKKDENCTLTIENLNSSAVYFCAACYHSAKYHCSSVQ